MDKTAVAALAIAVVGAVLTIGYGLDAAAPAFLLVIAVVVISRIVWHRRHDQPPSGDPPQPRAP